MKINELRMGNWVKTCTPNMEIMIPHLHAKVQAIGLFGGVEFLHSPEMEGFSMNGIHITGIPLTPEILEKAGFTYSNNEYEIIIEPGFSISLSPDTGNVRLFQDDNVIWVNAKYLHQLQNLYFALTGEELNVEL